MKRISIIILILGVFSIAMTEQPDPSVVRLDPRFDSLVPPDARIEQIAEGFNWVEGPVWVKEKNMLLFSDVVKNRIIQWTTDGQSSIFLEKSGYTGQTPFTGREPGSNGLTLDPEGRLVFCQHGDRRISRVEKDGRRTILVSHFQGKRLNSPNDLVFKSNGDLYFTDPPYGLPKRFEDPEKELDFQGIFRLRADGSLDLLEKQLKGPNGIAFSPDEKRLYVSDSAGSAWFVFDVLTDGGITNKRIFLDAGNLRQNGPGSPDGLKVDRNGNLFAAGPGGVYVIAPDGTLLGRFDMKVATGNCAWGDDGSTLFITANTAVYRVRLTTQGSETG